MVTDALSAARNPTVANLHAINPDLAIPENYAGSSDDEFLATLVNHIVTTGQRTLADIAADIIPYPSASLDDQFIHQAERWGIPYNQRYMLLYQFQPVLPADRQLHNHNYILMLAVNYRDRLLNMAPTVMRLLNNIPADAEPYLTIPQIDRLIATNDFLRSEGIVIDIDDLQRISSYWTETEIRDILTAGITAQEALDFTRLGVYDAAEIIENKGMIADDYINGLLNP